MSYLPIPKNYIPTIDEFYAGFEYGITDETGTRIVQYPAPSHGVGNMWVKYLDKDDLIDLGFYLKHEDGEKKVFFKNIVGDKPEYYVIELTNQLDLPYITLKDMYNHPMITELHIKNKSELKWLLNRYGILNN